MGEPLSPISSAPLGAPLGHSEEASKGGRGQREPRRGWGRDKSACSGAGAKLVLVSGVGGAPEDKGFLLKRASDHVLPLPPPLPGLPPGSY